MTVLLADSHILMSGPDHCSVCGHPFLGLHRFPILEWHGNTNIRICGKCCQKIKVGLIEDLIQVVAIMDMRDARYGSHHGQTEYTPLLTRTNEHTINEKHSFEEKEGRKIMLQLQRKPTT